MLWAVSGKGASAVVRPLSIRQLPINPKQRFERLFAVKPQWEAAELEPYLQGMQVGKQEMKKGGRKRLKQIKLARIAVRSNKRACSRKARKISQDGCVLQGKGSLVETRPSQNICKCSPCCHFGRSLVPRPIRVRAGAGLRTGLRMTQRC